jgi:hypothetical protein
MYSMKNLNPADLALLREDDALLEARAEHVRFFPGGRIALTDRGEAFYRAVCILLKLSPTEVDALTTTDALRKFVLKIHSLHLAAEHGVEIDGIDPDEAIRVLKTLATMSVEGMVDYVRQYEACAAARGQVVWVDFKNRTRILH